MFTPLHPVHYTSPLLFNPRINNSYASAFTYYPTKSANQIGTKDERGFKIWAEPILLPQSKNRFVLMRATYKPHSNIDVHKVQLQLDRTAAIKLEYAHAIVSTTRPAAPNVYHSGEPYHQTYIACLSHLTLKNLSPDHFWALLVQYDLIHFNNHVLTQLDAVHAFADKCGYTEAQRAILINGYNPLQDYTTLGSTTIYNNFIPIFATNISQQRSYALK